MDLGISGSDIGIVVAYLLATLGLAELMSWHIRYFRGYLLTGRSLATPILTGCGVALLLSGCGTYHRRGVSAERAAELALSWQDRVEPITTAREERILALDPEQVTEADIRELLAPGPAPQILLVHGGVQIAVPQMKSFADFLIGMGYPGKSITNLADATRTFSCYESSRKIAGSTAWYYEKSGLRPMMVGHSQGAMQVVKVLHLLAGPASSKVAVWNPWTWKAEPRDAICDPLTGEPQEVVGLQVPYATGVGGGGLTRFLPNQWSLWGRLRTIPDSVEEYTCFYKGIDLWGGDFLGFGPANHSQAGGTAVVRNVKLPVWYPHVGTPNTRHLVRSQAVIDWINAYNPADKPTWLGLKPKADTRHSLWAADVWHSVKKHWVLELQRFIRGRQADSLEP